MTFGDRLEETGWFEVSDEEGHKAALHPIAVIMRNGRVYSLMGAIRRNDAGEDEGGLVLFRQSRLANEEGTSYEVVGDDQEIEQVMAGMMEAFMDEAGQGMPGPFPDMGSECGVTHPGSRSFREFCVCGVEELLQ